MILLFTDFGRGGPYTGQMKAVLHREAPGVPVVELMSDAPAFDPEAASYLLAALCEEAPPGVVLLGVVDPGVGTASREPVALRAGGRWYVGPGNGLFSVCASRAASASVWRITWRPSRLSRSFHGRDLFAPVAAMLARGEDVPGTRADASALGPLDPPAELARVVYVDDFGNAMTGIRASAAAPGARMHAGGRALPRADTFDDVAPGEAFWYENSCGLAEVAVSRGSAAQTLGLRLGDSVELR
jgi:S-adenosylmethionine hydrolase